MRCMEPLTIEDVHIQPGKLTLRVRTASHARRTSDHLARLVVRDFPDLPQHSCVNPKGPAFASVIADTSVPHLLEHLIIDLQVQEEPPESQATFAGHTMWLDEAEGIASVTVSFRSDACALRAMAYACSYLNDALAKGA